MSSIPFPEPETISGKKAAEPLLHGNKLPQVLPLPAPAAVWLGRKRLCFARSRCQAVISITDTALPHVPTERGGKGSPVPLRGAKHPPRSQLGTSRAVPLPAHPPAEGDGEVG